MCRSTNAINYFPRTLSWCKYGETLWLKIAVAQLVYGGFVPDDRRSALRAASSDESLIGLPNNSASTDDRKAIYHALQVQTLHELLRDFIGRNGGSPPLVSSSLAFTKF